MGNKILIIICIVVFNIYSEWILEHPSFNNTISTVDVISPKEIWLGGDKGLIMHYNGVTMEIDSSIGKKYRNYTIVSIEFANIDTGWAICRSGNDVKLLKFNQKKWDIDSITNGVDVNTLRTLYSFSGKNALAVGSDGMVLQYDGELWKRVEVYDSNKSYSAPFFINDNCGWILDSDSVYRYIKGDWKSLTDLKIVYPWSILSSYFTDTLTGYFGSSNKIFRYKDGVWGLEKIQSSLSENFNFVALQLFDTTSGWAVGSTLYDCYCQNHGIILQRTQDGWHIRASTLGRTIGLKMFSDSFGTAFGEAGNFYIYDGNKWENMIHPSYEKVKQLKMLSQEYGWAISNRRLLVYNGSNWDDLNEINENKWNNFCLLKNNLGILVGDSGKIKKLDNSGWKKIDRICNYDLSAVDYTDNNNGWLGTSNGRAVSVKDGILVFDTALTTYMITDLFAFDSDNVVFSSMGGELFYFKNKKVYKHAAVFGFGENKLTLMSQNPLTGFLANGELFYFTEDSVRRIDDNNGTKIMANDVVMFNDTEGVAYGYGNYYVLKNRSWNYNRISIESEWIYSASFLDSSRGWIGGNNGHIYRTSNLGGSISEYQIKTKLPMGISAFPNPFNPIVYISFPRMTNSNWRISIFDITGSVVYKTNQALKNNITWDAKQATSGVYLISAINGKNKFTTKVVLEK